MPQYTIQITPKKAAFDPAAGQIKSDLKDLGEIELSAQVNTHRLFRLKGDFSMEEVKEISEKLLVDTIVEKYEILQTQKKVAKKSKAGGWVVDVWPRPGVTDPVGESVLKGIKDLGFLQEAQATSAMRYVFPRLKSKNRLEGFIKKNLANELINDIDFRKSN